MEDDVVKGKKGRSGRSSWRKQMREDWYRNPWMVVGVAAGVLTSVILALGALYALAQAIKPIAEPNIAHAMEDYSMEEVLGQDSEKLDRPAAGRHFCLLRMENITETPARTTLVEVPTPGRQGFVRVTGTTARVESGETFESIKLTLGRVGPTEQVIAYWVGSSCPTAGQIALNIINGD